LVEKGYRVRVYCPMGTAARDGLPDSLLENANSSFLRQSLEERPVEELLAPVVEKGSRGERGEGEYFILL